MALIHREPFREFEGLQSFREFEGLQRQMNRLFDNIMRTGDGGFSGGMTFVPAAKIQETSEAIHLKLEVPGMEAKDLDVQVTGEAVLISGDRQAENKTQEGGITHSEFRYGSFRRVIPLPAKIKNDQVQAEYKNGILSLTLPKQKQKRIKSLKLTWANRG